MGGKIKLRLFWVQETLVNGIKEDKIKCTENAECEWIYIYIYIHSIHIMYSRVEKYFSA